MYARRKTEKITRPGDAWFLSGAKNDKEID